MPLRRLTNSSFFPPGNQTGSSSLAGWASTRLAGSPFSVRLTSRSPWQPKATCLPSGERDAEVALEKFRSSTPVLGKSSAARNSSGTIWPLDRFNFQQ